MSPLDLLDGPPRSPRIKVSGIFFTARVIDKLRASLPHGEMNGYFALAGFSELWSHYTGIPLLELREVVERVESEKEVEAWIDSRTLGLDRNRINEKMATFDTGRTPETMQKMFEAAYPPDLRAQHTNLFDLLEADDARTFARG